MGERQGVDLVRDEEPAYAGGWTPSSRDRAALGELDLDGATDETLREAARIPGLGVLRARGEFTDAGVGALRGMTGLTVLTLESPLLEGGCALPAARLRSVCLAGERLTDRSLRMLGLHPGLETVRLAAGRADGTGLCWLPPGLRTLYLRLPRLAPESLDVLSQLPYLASLTFSGTAPTPRLVSRLVRHAGRLARVDFLGVEQPPPELLRALAEAGIKVNAALPV